MKEQRPQFAFSKGEISTFKAISQHRGLSVKKLSSITGKSESSVSQNVKELERKGIIKTKKIGMSKYVDVSNRNYAYSLLDMVRAEPLVPWEDLISNSNISILFKNTTGEDSFAYGLSPVSLWRGDRTLSMHGMRISKKQPVINSNRKLKNFIDEYSDHVSRKYLEGILPEDAVHLWRSGFRCLFKVKNDFYLGKKNLPKGTLPTALSVSPNYGIQLMTSDLYYYHEPDLKELTIEDTILHTILISPESQTYTSYALLLLFKAKDELNLQELTKKASRYGLEKESQKIVKYVKSHGRMREWPLPKLGELRDQANLYGIVIN